jgi:hypothetical protein
MKTTAKIILRSLAATPLKIALVYAGILVWLRIDFRPLPEWFGIAVAYFIHFSAAYFLALWVLHRRSGRLLDGFVVAFCFIVVGMLIEIFLFSLLSGPRLAFAGLFTWSGAVVQLCYLIGVACALIQVRLTLKRAASQV